MRLLALFAPALLIGLAACDATSSTIPDFGDPYEVERRPEPVLEGDTLRLTVSCPGACIQENFEVGYSLAGTELWLRHDSDASPDSPYSRNAILLPVDSSRRAPSPLRLYINRAETIALKEIEEGAAD